MFGVKIDSWEQVGQIAEGWTNDLIGREQELSESRMKICRKCPLYNAETDKCDSKKCYNKETGELSTYPQDGFICGCGCFLSKATRVPSKHCVLSRWKQ